VYSTYLGGRRDDQGSGIALDGCGNAYVTGSTGCAFPTTNALQAMRGGFNDAFVTKISDHSPILISYYDLSPMSLEHSGGTVTISAVAEMVGNGSVVATITKPDNSTVDVTLTRIAGDDESGTYSGTYTVPANTSGAVQTYPVSVRT